MEEKKYHSPLPWRVTNDHDAAIVDADGKPVGECHGCNDADLIVEAVNAYDKLRAENATLNEVAVNLQRSRAKIIEDNDKLRELTKLIIPVLKWGIKIVQWYDELTDIVGVNKKMAMERVLLEKLLAKARAALGEEAEQ